MREVDFGVQHSCDVFVVGKPSHVRSIRSQDTVGCLDGEDIAFKWAQPLYDELCRDRSIFAFSYKHLLGGAFDGSSRSRFFSCGELLGVDCNVVAVHVKVSFLGIPEGQKRIAKHPSIPLFPRAVYPVAKIGNQSLKCCFFVISTTLSVD